MWWDMHLCAAFDDMLVGEDVAIAGDNEACAGAPHCPLGWVTQPISSLHGTVRPR